MSMDDQMSLKDVKNRLSEVVDKVERQHDRVVITKHGRAAAVVLSVADLDSLEETLDILSRPKLLAQIRDSLAELDNEPAPVLSKDRRWLCAAEPRCPTFSRGRPPRAARYRGCRRRWPSRSSSSATRQRIHTALVSRFASRWKVCIAPDAATSASSTALTSKSRSSPSSIEQTCTDPAGNAFASAAVTVRTVRTMSAA